MKPVILAAALAVALALAAAAALLHATKDGIVVEGAGLRLHVEYRVLPEERVEEALRESAWDPPLPGSGAWRSLIEQGWLVLEVNVTLTNLRPIPVAIETGGPYCSTPFGSNYAPIDFDPVLVDVEGEHADVPEFCQLALIYHRLAPGESHESSYYFLVTPGYEGVLEIDVRVCGPAGPGECETIVFEAPVVLEGEG